MVGVEVGFARVGTLWKEGTCCRFISYARNATAGRLHFVSLAVWKTFPDSIRLEVLHGFRRTSWLAWRKTMMCIRGARVSGGFRRSRGGRLFPRRRAVYRAAIRQRNVVGKLAATWRVVRYIPVQGGKLLQLIASPTMRVVNGDRLLQLVSNRRNRPREVGVSAHQSKGIHIAVKHRVENHFGSDVDIRSLFFKSDDGRHATRFVAGNARLFVERHSDFVFCVEPFHNDHINAKAGSPRPCAASAVPWRVDTNLLRGSARIVPNRGGGNKRANLNNQNEADL